MFPAVHHGNRTSWSPAPPGVTDNVQAVTRVVPVAVETGEPRTVHRPPARDFTHWGRIVDMGRRIVPIAAVTCLFAGAPAMAGDQGARAQLMVEQVTSSVFEELESHREALQDDPERVYDLVDRLILPYFDFERMSRRVLGKRWKAATAEQRTRFVAAFRTLLVRTYALLLNEYNGQTMTYLDPVPRKSDDEVVIPVQVKLTGSQTVRVAYAMHGSGSDWKVFDVAVDGVSLVTNYRSSFRAEVARHGIDGLIASLESKNSAKN